MNTYPPTPLLTQHARERCREMEISTKIAKHILRTATLIRPAKPGSGCLVATSPVYARYAVVYRPGDPDQIITVLFNCRDYYRRNGSTYTPTTEETR